MGIGPGTGTGGARPGAGRKKGGKNMKNEEMQALAKRSARRAIARIRDIMDNGEDDKVRLAAAREMLDRGFGKPTQSMNHGGPNGGPIPFTFDMSGSANEKVDE